MSRFPPPSTTVLPISQGDTLTVKRRLTAGESRAAFTRMAVEGSDGQLRIDRLQQGVAICVAYLVDWSLVDDSGKPVVIRDQPPEVVLAALDALDPESFTEIKDAIEAHDVAILQARQAEKKSPDGASASSAISPSPDAATGDTSGSPHST